MLVFSTISFMSLTSCKVDKPDSMCMNILTRFRSVGFFFFFFFLLLSFYRVVLVQMDEWKERNMGRNARPSAEPW